jgi:cell division protein FtsN
MRTVFEEEEEIAPSDRRSDDGLYREPDRELTISSTTLLAIFFGLVLICGLFFGLGYTLGRRALAEASQLPTASPAGPAAVQQPFDNQPKPSAASEPAATPAPAPADESAQPATGASAADATSPESQGSPATQPPAPSALASPVKPAIAPAPATTQPAIPANPASTPAAAPGFVVQVAAISNPADADVLVSALEKRGYSVAARRFPGDPFIHVQIGPFTSRADAIAMRQKLLGDGYNAILK